MTRPIAPLFYIGVFLLIVIAAALMLSSVMSRGHEAGEEAAPAPRQALARQLQLLKHGDLAGLRPTVAEPLQADLTPQVLTDARIAYAAVTLDDLVGRIEVTDEYGARQATVYRPDGQVLTHLHWVGGDWLSDRIWFLQP